MLEAEYAEALCHVAPGSHESARNLVHYLAVRRRDIRSLQNDLSHLGLSSLGRMEAHVGATLEAVSGALEALSGRSSPPTGTRSESPGFARGDSLLHEHADRAFGPAPAGQDTRIMVTMPTEAATDRELVAALLEGGMTTARINCAHDDEATWLRIVTNIRSLAESMGRTCRISFDLAGPKLRTGPVEPLPAVRRYKPVRDAYGRVETPARIPLTGPEDAERECGSGPCPLPVNREFFEALRPGLRVELIDTRGRTRRLHVDQVTDGVGIALCERTVYIAPGTILRLVGEKEETLVEGVVQAFEPAPSFLTLRPGQRLILRKGDAPGRNAVVDDAGRETAPATISCDLEAVFVDALPGQPIFFDDGRIEGVIRAVGAEGLEIEIVRCSKIPARLRAEKGINLPETRLRIPGLTEKDISHLDFIVRHGDLVALSFVRHVEDVEDLLGELAKRGTEGPGIVLKIETGEGFRNLAALLLTAMRHPPVGVMIARGDLGVELGFERMAEVQEQILWLCEAAHVPVIWATQVLESLAKNGLATRGEITDAAMSCRAECVMLNKGPHIVRAVTTLRDILTRMSSHQLKKTSTLRQLHVADPPAMRDGAG